MQTISISQADSPSGSNLNALGFYLLVSLFFIIATMVEFAYVLLVCRVTGKVDNYTIAGKPKLNPRNSTGKVDNYKIAGKPKLNPRNSNDGSEPKGSIEMNNIHNDSSPATQFNDNNESTNWKIPPNRKCYLDPNIIDFVSVFVFLFSYVLFNCFYVFYYI